MSLVLGVRTLLAEIDWDEARTDEAEAAWHKLGLHLGFASTRPEKVYGTGPDILWALSSLHAVTSAKPDARRTRLRRRTSINSEAASDGMKSWLQRSTDCRSWCIRAGHPTLAVDAGG